MLLNHLDLHVPDVQRTAAVLVTYFGFRQEFSRTGLVILRDEANFELVVSEPVAGFGTADQMRLGVSTYHIGFILNSTEAVDQMYASLQLADVELGRLAPARQRLADRLLSAKLGRCGGRFRRH